METTEVRSPEVNITPPDEQGKANRFFDPKAPEQPDQVLGIDTSAILRLGRAVSALSLMPIGMNSERLSHAVRLMPLVEEMQTGTPLTPEDIRPYRRTIKKMKPSVAFADKAAAASGAVAIGILPRILINRKVERDFPKHAGKAIETAREALARIEDDVEVVASFDNPKEQFVSELNELKETVSTAIILERDERVRTGIVPEVKPEIPKGIAGFFVKAVYKIKSIFGFLRRRKPANNSEITAYDAGAGIQKTLNSLRMNKQNFETKLPLLSKLVLDRLSKNMGYTVDRLALAAPEILNFLFSALPKNETDNELLDSIERNPHELRFLAKRKRTFTDKRHRRYTLDGIQRASHNLLPAIRDILPTDGTKVREVFKNAQELLGYQLPKVEKPPKQKLRDRLKYLFKKSHKK